jgi:hypothetical protein
MMKASRLLIAGAVAAMLPFAGAVAQSPTPQSDPPSAPSSSSQQGATFESLDANSDGRISKSEAAANENVTAQFSKYDKNGNGYIEKEEVTATNTAPSENPPKQ